MQDRIRQLVRYDAASLTRTTTVSTPGAAPLPVDYVETRYGTVARVWITDDRTEVSLRRPGNARATVQGGVQPVPGGWAGFNPEGIRVTMPHPDYTDAEAPLLLRRTGRRASRKLTWPSRPAVHSATGKPDRRDR